MSTRILTSTRSSWKKSLANKLISHPKAYCRSAFSFGENLILSLVLSAVSNTVRVLLTEKIRSISGAPPGGAMRLIAFLLFVCSAVCAQQTSKPLDGHPWDLAVWGSGGCRAPAAAQSTHH